MGSNNKENYFTIDKRTVYNKNFICSHLQMPDFEVNYFAAILHMKY